MKTVTVTPAQMRRRIARLADVQGQTRESTMPDDLVAELRAQTVYGVITSEAPSTSTGTDDFRLWDQAPIASGVDNFAANIVKCTPNQGPAWHVHRAAFENFMPLTGTWRFHWGEPGDFHAEDLGPFDTISFPPGVVRRFENVAETDSLMFIYVYSGREHSIENDGIMPTFELERLEREYAGKSPGHDDALGKLRVLVDGYEQSPAERATVERSQRLIDSLG